MSRIVMKFGGTSVGTPAALRRLIAHVGRVSPAPLVVVSAVGGVTDLLIRAADVARTGQDVSPTIEAIQSKHEAILRAFDLAPDLLLDLERELGGLLHGVALLRELSPRVFDILQSLGERMSIRLVAGALSQEGVPALARPSWDLGMLTTSNYGRSVPVPEAYTRIKQAVAAQDPDSVLVTTGFIGKDAEGEITTFGRGGSDYSGAVFGAAIGAPEIQIWTDVPGILRADPRVIDGPSVVRACRFDEAAELAFFGAKVLHPRTIEPARERGIPVRVLGTFQVDPDGEQALSEQGTVIHDDVEVEDVRALAIRKRVQSLDVFSLGMLDAPGFLARIFTVLAHHGVSVDVVATSEVSVSMTFDGDSPEGLDAAVAEILDFANVSQDDSRGLLCIVGAGMRDNPKLRAKIFNVLGENDISLQVISQGASRVNMTLVLAAEDTTRAMSALHDALFR